MLDPQPPAVERVGGVGDITGGEDARHAGLQPLIREDAVLDRESRRSRRAPVRGAHADADDDAWALDDRAVAGENALDRALALEALDRRLGQELDPVVAVKIEIELAELRRREPARAATTPSRPSSPRTPSARADAAISAPIQPDPTTTSRSAASIAAAIALRVRRAFAGSGCRRARRREHRCGGAPRRSPAAAGRRRGARRRRGRAPGRRGRSPVTGVAGQQVDRVARRKSPPGGHRASRAQPRRAGTPSRAAGARTGARARRR